MSSQVRLQTSKKGTFTWRFYGFSFWVQIKLSVIIGNYFSVNRILCNSILGIDTQVVKKKDYRIGHIRLLSWYSLRHCYIAETQVQFVTSASVKSLFIRKHLEVVGQTSQLTSYRHY